MRKVRTSVTDERTFDKSSEQTRQFSYSPLEGFAAIAPKRARTAETIRKILICIKSSTKFKLKQKQITSNNQNSL
jgi:hypothetical protein